MTRSPDTSLAQQNGNKLQSSMLSALEKDLRQLSQLLQELGGANNKRTSAKAVSPTAQPPVAPTPAPASGPGAVPGQASSPSKGGRTMTFTNDGNSPLTINFTPNAGEKAIPPVTLQAGKTQTSGTDQNLLASAPDSIQAKDAAGKAYGIKKTTTSNVQDQDIVNFYRQHVGAAEGYVIPTDDASTLGTSDSNLVVHMKNLA